MQTQINITHSYIPLVQAGLVNKMIISIVITLIMHILHYFKALSCDHQPHLEDWYGMYMQPHVVLEFM